MFDFPGHRRHMRIFLHENLPLNRYFWPLCFLRLSCSLREEIWAFGSFRTNRPGKQHCHRKLLIYFAKSLEARTSGKLKSNSVKLCLTVRIRQNAFFREIYLDFFPSRGLYFNNTRPAHGDPILCISSLLNPREGTPGICGAFGFSEEFVVKKIPLWGLQIWANLIKYPPPSQWIKK